MSLPQSTDAVKLIGNEMFKELIEQAQNSPRKRKNYNFHPSMDSNPHRFMNVLCRGTYITPHRHLHPPKAESFLILEGAVVFFIFNDDGSIKEKHLLGRMPGKRMSMGIDIAPGIWHNLVTLTDYAVCYEVKPGPYVVSDDKEFADWAPHEGSAGCDEYMAELLTHAPQI